MPSLESDSPIIVKQPRQDADRNLPVGGLGLPEFRIETRFLLRKMGQLFAERLEHVVSGLFGPRSTNGSDDLLLFFRWREDSGQAQ
jgi:hypothetical protein